MCVQFLTALARSVGTTTGALVSSAFDMPTCSPYMHLAKALIATLCMTGQQHRQVSAVFSEVGPLRCYFYPPPQYLLQLAVERPVSKNVKSGDPLLVALDFHMYKPKQKSVCSFAFRLSRNTVQSSHVYFNNLLHHRTINIIQQHCFYYNTSTEMEITPGRLLDNIMLKLNMTNKSNLPNSVTLPTKFHSKDASQFPMQQTPECEVYRMCHSVNISDA